MTEALETQIRARDGPGSYNLTISQPDRPISVQNIAANAVEILGGGK